MDPQSRPGEFNLPCLGGGRSGIQGSVKTHLTVRLSSASALSPGRAPRPVLGRSEAGREGDLPSLAMGGVIARLVSIVLETEDLPCLVRSRLSACVRLGKHCLQGSPTAWVARRSGSAGHFGSVANRSVLHPTRLETRTKESNMCASHGVFVRNLKAQ